MNTANSSEESEQSVCYWKDVWRKLYDMRITRQLCDVELITDEGSIFKAHSNVLAASSAVLYSHFVKGERTFISKLSPTKHKLTGVTSKVLNVTLDFVYGVAPETITDFKRLQKGANIMGITAASVFCRTQRNELEHLAKDSNEQNESSTEVSDTSVVTNNTSNEIAENRSICTRSSAPSPSKAQDLLMQCPYLSKMSDDKHGIVPLKKRFLLKVLSQLKEEESPVRGRNTVNGIDNIASGYADSSSGKISESQCNISTLNKPQKMNSENGKIIHDVVNINSSGMDIYINNEENHNRSKVATEVNVSYFNIVNDPESYDGATNQTSSIASSADVVEPYHEPHHIHELDLGDMAIPCPYLQKRAGSFDPYPGLDMDILSNDNDVAVVKHYNDKNLDKEAIQDKAREELIAADLISGVLSNKPITFIDSKQSSPLSNFDEDKMNSILETCKATDDQYTGSTYLSEDSLVNDNSNSCSVQNLNDFDLVPYTSTGGIGRSGVNDSNQMLPAVTYAMSSSSVPQLTSSVYNGNSINLSSINGNTLKHSKLSADNSSCFNNNNLASFSQIAISRKSDIKTSTDTTMSIAPDSTVSLAEISSSLFKSNMDAGAPVSSMVSFPERNASSLFKSEMVQSNNQKCPFAHDRQLAHQSLEHSTHESSYTTLLNSNSNDIELGKANLLKAEPVPYRQNVSGNKRSYSESEESDNIDEEESCETQCQKITSENGSAFSKIVQGKNVTQTSDDFEKIEHGEIDNKKICNLLIAKSGSLTAQGKRLYKCIAENCDYTNKSIEYVQSHLYYRHAFGKPSILCQECDKRYFSEAQLKTHMKQTHSASTPKMRKHECEDCSEVFKTSQSLHMHQLKTHGKGKLFSCEDCMFKSPRKKDLQGHMISQHDKAPPGVRVYECTYCLYKCIDKNRFSEHEASHTQEKSFKCESCGNFYATRRGLRNHMKYHSDERPHVCPSCNASFKVRAKLRDHIRLLHDQKGSKPYKCGHCDFYASVRGNVNQHIRNVHKGMPIEVTDTLKGQRKHVKDYDYANITGTDIEEVKDASAVGYAAVGRVLDCSDVAEFKQE